MLNAKGITTAKKKFKMDDGNLKKKLDEEEERWSHIPSLLLWMIKDRLNIADSARVAFVCKYWEYVSLSYPSKIKLGEQQQGGAVPWLMWQIPSIHTAYEFLNVTTMESLTLKLAESHDRTTFLTSKHGWLLFQTKGCPGFSSIVLLNPHTNAKITIPYLHNILVGYMTSFSLSLEDGTPTPQYVVSVLMSGDRHWSFYIARVSDKTWNEYSYSENGRKMVASASLVVHGDKAYLLDLEGGLLIFDMNKLSWKKLNNTNREIASIYKYNTQLLIMESEQGDILMIDRGRDSKSFSFFKLNESQTGWEELSTVNNQEKRSWFLCLSNNNFSVKESQPRTNKVYELTTCPGNKPIVHIHDLTNHSIQAYKPRPPYEEWVDLGWMDKLPPFCVRYVPSPQY